MVTPTQFGRDIYTREEVVNILNNMPDLLTQSLTAFLYVTGCRISEALHLVKTPDNIRLGDNYVYIRLKTLKTKVSIPYRDLQFTYETPFMNIILNQIGRVNDGDKVFDIPYKSFWRKMNKVNSFGWIHLFRHTRMTKLARKGVSEHQLTYFAGWADPRPSKKYVKMSPELIKGLAEKID